MSCDVPSLLYRAVSRANVTVGLIVMNQTMKLLLRPNILRAGSRIYAYECLHLIRDRALREKLRPDYIPLCKRQAVSGIYFRAVQQLNVKVVTDRIAHADRRGACAGFSKCVV